MMRITTDINLRNVLLYRTRSRNSSLELSDLLTLALSFFVLFDYLPVYKQELSSGTEIADVLFILTHLGAYNTL